MMSMISVVNSQHEDVIHDAKLDYYGIQLATCSSDESVRIFDVRNQNHLLKAELKEHSGPVWQIAWSHPIFGPLLASCSYDKKVIIWHEVKARWTKLHEYSGHDSSVNSVAWAPPEFGCNASLVCGSSDGSVSVLTRSSTGTNWTAVRIKDAHIMGVTAVCWAPAGFRHPIDQDLELAVSARFSMLNFSPALGSEVSAADSQETANHGSAATNQLVQVRRFASAGCDRCIRIWKQAKDGDWKEECRLERHDDWVRDLDWADDLGLHRSKIASCSQDGTVIIWTLCVRANNGQPTEGGMLADSVSNLSAVPTSGSSRIQWSPIVLHQFADPVWGVSWSVTGNVLAVTGADNKVSIWREGLDGIWTCVNNGDCSITPQPSKISD